MRFFQRLFGKPQPSRQTCRGFGKTFVLEPILTPSGLLDVDGGDESPDFDSIDVPDLEPVELSDLAPHPLIDEADLEDINFFGAEGDPELFADTSIDLDSSPDVDANEPLDLDSDTDFIAPSGQSADDLEPLDDSGDAGDLLVPPIVTGDETRAVFQDGIFTVGDGGRVGIDNLFDGGAYQGELAIFNIDGLDDFDFENPEEFRSFLLEASDRALSDSPFGHVVISDLTEGAKFTGNLPEGNFNSGEYLGVKSFEMNPGDKFAVMIVPNGSVQRIYDILSAGEDLPYDLQPLFSLGTANPNDTFHLAQFADVTGDGSTFGMEDLRTDGWTDRDYNDFVFQVRGAVGKASLMDEVVNPDNDWRGTEMGQALIEYAKPYIEPEGHDGHWHEELPEELELDPDLPPITIGDSTDLDSNEFPESNQPLVGIIDTGFNENNPYLDYDRMTVGQDYVSGDTNSLLQPGEGNEHGTHVLGIISETNSNAPVWVSRAVDSGKWAESLVEFVDAAKESGQPNAVVNLSFDLTQINSDRVEATRYEFTPTEWAALEYARENQIVIVAAAGNDAAEISALGQASQQFDNIVTVGAAETLDASLPIATGVDRAYYSSYGDGVNLVAFGGTVENPILSTVGEGFGEMSGTSVATAKVTGAISQVWAANPKLNYQQVISIIESTATDLLAENWDAQTGTGLLNIAAAVHLAKATEPTELEPKVLVRPKTWSDALQSSERPVNVTEANFSGKVTSTVGARVRSGPGTNYSQVGFKNYNEAVNFNGWMEGEWVDYTNEGLKRSNLWYRVAGTSNQWISGAIIDSDPPSTPPPNPNQFAFKGKTYIWVPYIIKRGDTLSAIARRTMGNGTKEYYDFIARKNNIENPHLIYAGRTILVPQAVGSNPNPPQPTPRPTPVAPDKFYNPLSGSNYRVSSQFGYRDESSWNGDNWHNGIDLAASAGTPVKAAKNGKVVFAGWNNQGYGNLIIIEHNDGTRSYYAHLSSINVSSGRSVTAGSQIGKVGNTGNSFGAHLHFEIRVSPYRYRTNSKNPKDYIRF